MEQEQSLSERIIESAELHRSIPEENNIVFVLPEDSDFPSVNPIINLLYTRGFRAEFSQVKHELVVKW